MSAARWPAIGGVVGPVGFVLAWVVCGLVTEDYSPIDEAISELAAVGAPTRVAMSMGFLVFAVGVGTFALSCPTILPGWSWLALALAAAVTAGAAVFPLSGEGERFDVAHGAFAGAGYVFLIAAPALAAVAFHRTGQRPWAVWSAGVAAVAAVCLVASVAVEANGFFQRLGLTTVDIWIVAVAGSLLAGNQLVRPGVSPGDG